MRPHPLGSPEVVALLLVPIFVGAVFWTSAWIHYRMVNRDKPVTSLQRRLMRYWTSFVTGAGYALFIPLILGKPKQFGFVLAAGWGLILLALHRRRFNRDRAGTTDSM